MNLSFGSCTKCNASLPDEVFNAADFIRCPSCNSKIRIDVFPALLESPSSGPAAQSLLVESEASCFYHEKKKAVVPCDYCGRFLCALCDVELNGEHFCPSCLESGTKKGKLRNLQNHRILYDSIALSLAVLPAILIWPSIVTAPMAIFIAIRYWRAPLSIIPRTKVRFVLAIALATPQILGWAALVYTLLHKGSAGT
jgi:hypothetical protein